jgi:glycosyltransferase involved in cell wall biosynthesis
VLNVLQVVDSLDVGGAERHVVDLATALRRRGHRVQLACSVAGPLAAELAAAGIGVRPLMPALVKRRACPEFAARLGALVRAGGFDVVHAHIHASAAAAARAIIGTGSALVLTEHTEAPWRGPLDRRVSDRVYARAGSLLAVSRAVGEMLRTQYSVAASRVQVVPPAITPEHVPPADRPLHWWGRPVVGRVCRLQPEKGVDVFLRAAALVREQVPDAVFVVVGDGPLAGELRALADELGLGASVELLGHQRGARALIGAMDVMALTSRSEGSPLVVSEALAAGVPVVASAVGGVPDQLRDEVEGLLVPPENPAALAASLLRLLRDADLTARLRRGALCRAAASSHAGMVDAVEAAYTRALARGGDADDTYRSGARAGA